MEERAPCWLAPKKEKVEDEKGASSASVTRVGSAAVSKVEKVGKNEKVTEVEKVERAGQVKVDASSSSGDAWLGVMVKAKARPRRTIPISMHEDGVPVAGRGKKEKEETEEAEMALPVEALDEATARAMELIACKGELDQL
jgi:hypothetical protein